MNPKSDKPIRIQINGKIREEPTGEYYDMEVIDVETGRFITNITAIEFIETITAKNMQIPQVKITILRPDLNIEVQMQSKDDLNVDTGPLAK